MEPNTEANYEVRYLLNGEESTNEVAAKSAAEANEITKQQALSESEDQYELIQVQLLQESDESSEN